MPIPQAREPVAQEREHVAPKTQESPAAARVPPTPPPSAAWIPPGVWGQKAREEAAKNAKHVQVPNTQVEVFSHKFHVYPRSQLSLHLLYMWHLWWRKSFNQPRKSLKFTNLKNTLHRFQTHVGEKESVKN